MYAVTARVEVETGSIDELATLFDESNRALVADHPDWVGAWFTADREASQVTVIARWKDATSYTRLRESEDFQQIVSRFASRFVSAPQVSVNELLVEM
jgi:quinol monooxygenase YgiN